MKYLLHLDGQQCRTRKVLLLISAATQRYLWIVWYASNCFKEFEASPVFVAINLKNTSFFQTPTPASLAACTF